eukprot:8849627-Pyramimonas_sp.AAC.1
MCIRDSLIRASGSSSLLTLHRAVVPRQRRWGHLQHHMSRKASWEISTIGEGGCEGEERESME